MSTLKAERHLQAHERIDPAARGSAMTARHRADVSVTYLPILDVARGVAAGYQAQVAIDAPDPDTDLIATDIDGAVTARGIVTALAASSTLPTNTFLSLPLGVSVAATPLVRAALGAHGSLRGIVLDITGFSGSTPIGDLEHVLAQYRDAGALIAVGGHRAAQPELSSVIRLKPSIMRLGRDWIRDIDNSESKRAAIEVIGRLASQLDAWILAEGVSTPAELRALAGLAVPLAQGSLVGEAHRFWPSVELDARTALPPVTHRSDGVLRSLLQPAYTTRDALAAAAVLPETSGYDLVVVLDEFQRPVTLLEPGASTAWETSDILAVNIDTAVAEAVSRAMVRPRAARFSPLACTDDAGRFLGILPIEKLMSHLAG